MKRICGLLLLIFALLPMRGYADNAAYEAEMQKIIDEGTAAVLEELDLVELEELYAQTSLAENVDFSQMLADITENGISTVTVERALRSIGAALLAGLRKNALCIAEIAVILLVTGVLKRLPSEGKGAAEIAAWTGYIVACGIAIGMLMRCFSEGRQALQTLFRIIEVLTPILLVLLTGMGGLTGASVMSPIMATLTGSVFELVEQVIFPLLIAGAVIAAVSCISATVRLDRLSELLGSVVKWALGILFTVFLGVSALKGIAGATTDGIYFRTAKYTIDRMVPVIGGMFSDTLDTLMACSLLVKNAVGFMGLMIMAAMLLSPLMTCAATMLSFRAGAALTEPFADERAVRLMEKMGKTAELAFLVVLTCVAMAFISMALLMGAADMRYTR